MGESGNAGYCETVIGNGSYKFFPIPNPKSSIAIPQSQLNCATN